MINFTIAGDPVAKARPRVTTVGGFARAYTPKKSKQYEDHVSYCAIAAMNEAGLDKPLEKPVKLTIIAYMPIPKSMNKRDRSNAVAGLLFPAKKPDIDNVAKSILDGLNAIVFKDDNQVVQLDVQKLYSEQPRVEVNVKELFSS